MLTHPHITTTHHTYNPHSPHTETDGRDFTPQAMITGIKQVGTNCLHTLHDMTVTAVCIL